MTPMTNQHVPTLTPTGNGADDGGARRPPAVEPSRQASSRPRIVGFARRHLAVTLVASAAVGAVVAAAVLLPRAGRANDQRDEARAESAVARDRAAQAEDALDAARGAVFAPEAGDCFQDEGQEIVSCATRHDNEVFAVLEYPDAERDYPGTADLDRYAERQCLDQFEGYVGRGYEASELYALTVVPSGVTWALGDREIVCGAYLPGDTLTGSIRGTGR
jgi:hypothetical protein